MIKTLPFAFDAEQLLRGLKDVPVEPTSHGMVRTVAYEKDGHYELMPAVKDKYLTNTIQAIGQCYHVTRIREVTLRPLACYPWHTDMDAYRVHIVLNTNAGCWFVSAGEPPEQMSEIGQAYLFRSNVPHTALNGGMDFRTHLLFNTAVVT